LALHHLNTRRNDVKILLIKNGMLGDILMMTPTIRRLKRLYPEYEIYTRTYSQFIPALRDNKYLSGTNEDLIYDEIIDFQSVYDPTKSENKIHFFFEYTNKKIDLQLDKLTDEDYEYDLAAPKNSPVFQNYVLFSTKCASSDWKGRELRDDRPYYELGMALNEDGFTTVEIDYGGRKSGTCNVCLPHSTLEFFLSLVYHSTFVVSVDTGTLHVAQAYQKPTIAIFGKIPAASRIIPSYIGKHVFPVFLPNLPCIGCYASIQSSSFCDQDEACMHLSGGSLRETYAKHIKGVSPLP